MNMNANQGRGSIWKKPPSADVSTNPELDNNASESLKSKLLFNRRLKMNPGVVQNDNIGRNYD